ncbi:hypothetical protein ACMYSN_04890 [Klebsiella sp. R445]
MLKRGIALSLLCASSVFAQQNSEGWEATLNLSTIQDLHKTPPTTLVPKQSIQLTATVWMPEKVNWFPQYPQWDMPGATVVPLFMLSPSLERPQSNFTQRGATQNYLLTPLSEGTLALSPTSLTLYPDRQDSPTLPLPAVSVEVAMPEGAGDIAHFLPATEVKIRQSFSLLTADKQEQTLDADALKKVTLKNGQLIERQILIEAQGVQGKLIPELSVDPQVAQHEAETTDTLNYDEFIGGTRTERWFYAPQSSGTLTLNPLKIRWYDTQHQRFRTTSVDGLTLKSESTEVAQPAISLSVGERLSMLSAKTWWFIVSGIVLLLMLTVFRKHLSHTLSIRLRHWANRIKRSPRTKFLLLCLHIMLAGAERGSVRQRYQSWQATHIDQKSADAAVFSQWAVAAYSQSGGEFPNRFALISALCQQRRVGKEKKRWRFLSPCELPEVNGRSSRV